LEEQTIPSQGSKIQFSCTYGGTQHTFLRHQIHPKLLLALFLVRQLAVIVMLPLQRLRALLCTRVKTQGGNFSSKPAQHASLFRYEPQCSNLRGKGKQPTDKHVKLDKLARVR
jgi:hypothetical protein